MPENKKKLHDYSTLLIWSAALVTVVRYAAAFIASDATKIGETLSRIITYAMGVSGLGMGILDVIGGTYLFTGWQKKMPKNGDPWSFKFKVLTFFAIGLIVNGILILIPFTMSRVAGVSIHHILGDGILLFGWSAVVNVAPYLLIGGVAVGNMMVTIDERKVTGNLPESFRPQDEVAGKFPKDWRKVRKTLSAEQVKAIAISESKNLALTYGIDERTARNWRKYAQDEVKPS
jgi:hypothetical protein